MQKLMTLSNSEVELIDTEELSKRLGLDRVTIWRLRKDGIIKGSRKIGHSVRYIWSEVVANFPECKVEQ
jgi:predicted DNA-binding transcriptional regulator AlpA